MPFTVDPNQSEFVADVFLHLINFVYPVLDLALLFTGMWERFIDLPEKNGKKRTFKLYFDPVGILPFLSLRRYLLSKKKNRNMLGKQNSFFTSNLLNRIPTWRQFRQIMHRNTNAAKQF